MKPHTAQGACVSLAKLCSPLLAAAMLLWPGAVRAQETVNCPTGGMIFQRSKMRLSRPEMGAKCLSAATAQQFQIQTEIFRLCLSRTSKM